MKTWTKNRACNGKRGHKTQAAAEAHRQKLIEGGAWGPSLIIYRCRGKKGCGMLHVGHQSPALYSERYNW